MQSFNNLNYSREKLDDGKVRLEVEVADERFDLVKNRVYEKLAKEVSIEGFRPGKAPQNVVTAKLGPKLYEETLQEIVPEATLEVLKREKLTPIDRIEYQVLKVGEGAGVKFTATFTTFPDFDLPDLKKIQIKKKKINVEKKEVEKVIKKMYEEDKNKKKYKLDDKWASSLNLKVKNLKELNEKVQEELKRQKSLMEDDRILNEVLKKIREKTDFSVPKTFIEQEVNNREQDYKKRVENLGMKLEDFLRNQKTTLKELKKDWEKDANQKLENEIIFMKVAEKYEISVPMEEVEKQIETIKDEKIKAQYNNDSSKRYLQSMLVRQKIVQKILSIVK